MKRGGVISKEKSPLSLVLPCYSQEMSVGFAEPCHCTRQQRANARIIHQVRPKHYVEKGVFTLTVTALVATAALLVTAIAATAIGATAGVAAVICAAVVVIFRSFLATVGTTVAFAAVTVARSLLLVTASRPRVTIGPIQALNAGVAGHLRRQKGHVVLRVRDLK